MCGTPGRCKKTGRGALTMNTHVMIGFYGFGQLRITMEGGILTTSPSLAKAGRSVGGASR
jgi:hypothetical protein